MNTSRPVTEGGAEGSTVSCLAITVKGDMQVEDDIGDLDETQVQEPGSKRHMESDAAKDLLEALCSKLRQDAVVRDQCKAERMAERDAAAAAALGRQGCSNGDETGKSDEEPFRVGGHQNYGWETGKS